MSDVRDYFYKMTVDRGKNGQYKARTKISQEVLISIQKRKKSEW